MTESTITDGGTHTHSAESNRITIRELSSDATPVPHA